MIDVGQIHKDRAEKSDDVFEIASWFHAYAPTVRRRRSIYVVISLENMPRQFAERVFQAAYKAVKGKTASLYDSELCGTAGYNAADAKRKNQSGVFIRKI